MMFSWEKNSWCAEWGNLGGFWNKRNLPSTLPSANQSILWGFCECCHCQHLKNMNIGVWSIYNAPLRNPILKGDQRTEIGVCYSPISSAWCCDKDEVAPHSGGIGGMCGWAVPGLHSAWRPLLFATHITSPDLHAQLFQHQLVMWYLKHQIFFPCLSTL